MSVIENKSYVEYLFEGRNYDLDNPLYIDPTNPKRNLSSRQIETMVSEIAAGLKYYGLKKGDPVCVMALNDIYYTPLYLGIMAAGGIFMGTNPGNTAHELEHQLRLCKIKFMITSVSSLDVARKACVAVNLPSNKIFVFNPRFDDIPSNYQSWWRLFEHGQAEWETVVDSTDEACSYISSSGTSGLPKAVVIPHKYLENQVDGLIMRKLPYRVSRLICIPPFAGYNVPSNHGAPIKVGEPCYVLPRYEITAVLAAVKKFQITECLLIPPILLDMPQNQLVLADPAALMPLRQIFCGGAAIGKGVQSRLYALLHPDARIAQVYGLTEAGWTCASLYPEKDETGSVGKPLPTYEVKIVDDGEVEITKPNVRGEIFVKAKYPMLGYFNNDTASNAAFAPGGFIRTGDLGHVSENGLYYITDRKKDVIKVRGWQVSPAECEEALLMHPDIKDAAVIARKLPEPSTEEVVQAYVVVKEACSLTERDVVNHMRAEVSKYKVPQEVFFMEALPRNPTGKIIRRLIPSEYLEYTRRKSFEEEREKLLGASLHVDGFDTQILITPSASPRASPPSPALPKEIELCCCGKPKGHATMSSHLLSRLQDQVRKDRAGAGRAGGRDNPKREDSDVSDKENTKVFI